MHLTSVRLRGFKSFADDTTLTFTPGITAIVGPNGSGKSNIVDALTWVLGTRSPRQLRGAQMSDVIFAGSGSRRGMGRASVDITIDNADGLLPIEFSEVTIGRSLFANGEGGSAINGADCRQIDVADLLSDTGLGRESHTIVGQGKIDAILTTEAAGRRVFIEEAAGILKHRRRKDRAQRKIAQLDEHLVRLDDTAAELQRLAKPLKRQAGVAQQKRRLDAIAQDITVELALRAWAQAAHAHTQAMASVRQTDTGSADAKEALTAAKTALANVEGELDQANRAYASISQVAHDLRTLTERAKGVAGRIDERRAGLANAGDGEVIGRDPARLREEATEGQTKVAHLQTVSEQAKALLAASEAERDRLADIVRTLQHEQADRQRARTQAREAKIRWEGALANLTNRLQHTDQRISEAQQRATDSANALAELTRQDVDVAGPTEEDFTAAVNTLGAAKTARAQADEAVRALRIQEREVGQAAARAVAAAEAKEAMANQLPDGTKELVDADAGTVVGALLAALTIDESHVRAVSAALGARAQAVLVNDPQAAQAWLDAHERAAWLVSTTQSPIDRPLPPVANAQWLPEVVQATPAVATAVARMLGDIWLVDDVFLAAAEAPDAVFIDPSGLMAGAWGVGRAQGSGTEAVLAAKEAAVEARHEATALAEQLAEISDALAVAINGQEAAAEHLNEVTATATRLQAEAKAALAARQQHEQALARAQQGVDTATRQLDTAQAQREALLAEQATLQAAEPEPVPMDSPEELAAVAKARVDHEQSQEKVVEARLAVQQVDQEITRITKEIQSLLVEADRIEADLAAMRQRREARLEALAQCDALVGRARAIWVQTETSAQAAKTKVEQAKQTRDSLAATTKAARSAVAEAQDALDQVTQTLHEAELQAQRAQGVLDHAQEQLQHLGIEDAADLIETRARAIEVDRSDKIDADAISTSITQPSIGVRDEPTDVLEGQLADLKAKINRLGPVNPLAAREYAELEQRRSFLADQIGDLTQARRDLIRLVDAVELHIGQVFSAAFADVAANFELFFDLLFPGGKGRLVLTDADDPLTTGIEIEASPPGKKVRHLSLLSGGERTLTALAMLFAIFAARPSPFYVLDEVEAALDDANLERFVRLLSQFRNQGQWIVVTHQRRTMEAADVLHGISMNSDGVSVVLTQHLRDVADLHP